MKCTMADDPEEFNLFSVGTIVSCKTCFGDDYEGEVIAFDYQTKILFIKCSSKSGKANVHDMRMINLDFVEDVVIKKEVTTPVNGTQSLLPLNIEKLSGRAKQHVKERQRLVTALTAGVGNEAVRLFLAITKTIAEVTWQGKNIVVMNQVTITPPYRPENCKPIGKGDGDAVNHVRRIVEKYFKDQAQAQPPQTQQTQSRPHLQ
ncbi:protein LSM12 homolog [Trichonephila inaurata madagascariensis]|uniref:Protein LSM12 homolog n=1 Tax=Trichonephila inaurata madagascariensis TaxID=2747483 RepID=A0A8X6XA54_9ARAC|nr:protein LSM12 homolog [Trichonephila inaurata madagascariensis]